MRPLQKILVALAITASCATTAAAQIYVTVRPSRPVYVRTTAPSPRHVWIEEDWTGVGNTYEWRGGYWAEPPHPGYYYRAGHWQHGPTGYYWVGGHWGPKRHNWHKHHKH